MTQNQYEFQRKIGEGAYGVVYQVYDKINQQIIAMKILKDDIKGISQTALRETAHLLRLKGHPNIIEIIDIKTNISINDEIDFIIILELMESDLSQLIKNNIELDQKSIFRQLLNGVSYMHSQSIIHRDLKPQNILSKGNQLKITDFGLSRNYSAFSKFTVDIATLQYKPPETLLGDEYYSYAIDIWGLGCIFYEIIMKQTLFIGQSQIEILFRIFQIFGTPECEYFKQLPNFKNTFPKFEPEGFQNDLKLNITIIDLLKQLLCLDPRKRISAQQALQHKYFSD